MPLTIESMTHLGAGRAENGTLLPRTLPGEVVEVGANGTVRILTPSPVRVMPPCPHYRTCGGCDTQHASDPFVAEWKQTIVQRALAAHGLTAPFREIATSPSQSRRRAKFSARRTKNGVQVGFHSRGSDTIVDIPECQLLTPQLRATLPALKALTQLVASRRAEIGLTVTQSAAGPDILVDTDLPLTSDLRISIAAFAQSHRLARVSWVDETVVEMSPPSQSFGTASVVPPPGAFLQATAAGEAALLAAVDEATSGARRIADLFAGCGTFCLPLAKRADVHAVEGDAAMIAALDRGWRGAVRLKRLTTQTRDLFRRPLEKDELASFDAVVIDPPRAGAEAQCKALSESVVGKIAMVSCNPVTFARDASRLASGGYTLNWVQVVDQFRWSAHVEIAAAFTRP